jgi:hypothetical protein
VIPTMPTDAANATVVSTASQRRTRNMVWTPSDLFRKARDTPRQPRGFSPSLIISVGRPDSL